MNFKGSIYNKIGNLLHILIDKYDILFPWVALLFALIAILRSIQFLNYVNIVLGVFLLLFALIYFAIKDHTIDCQKISHNSIKIVRGSYILFILSYIIALISLYYYSTPLERPIIFFIFFICMLSIVLSQILINFDNNFVILCEIIFLLLFYIFTQALLFSSLMSIDSYTHMFITNSIVNTGFIYERTSSYLYIFHILHAEIEITSGLSYNYTNLLCVLPAAMICMVVTIFLIGRKIISSQVGLLASLILVCSTYFLYFSSNFIPNSYSAIFFVFALFCILCVFDQKTGNIMFILLIVLIVLVTVTHLLVDVALIIILSTYVICINKLKRMDTAIERNKLNYWLIAFALLIFVVVIMDITHTLTQLVDFVNSGMDIAKIQTLTPLKNSVALVPPFFESLHEKICMYIFWIFGIFGCIYLIQKTNKNIKQVVFSFAALSFFVFFFLIIVTGLELINIRFYYIISFLCCIPAAIFLILSFQYSKKIYVKMGVIVIILSLCIVCIIFPLANISNPLYNNYVGPQIYPHESELYMLSTLRTIDENKPLASDSTIEYTEMNSGRADITSIDASILFLNFKNDKDKIIIISDSIFKMTPGKEIFFPENNLVTYSLASDKFSKIVDVGYARSYVYN
jgi:hypothetical protein